MPEQTLPILRGLLARGDLLPLLTAPQAARDATPPESASRLASRERMDALRALAARLTSRDDHLEIEGLGTVRIRWPSRPGRAMGKIAVVTGAAQGVGLEIAENLIAAGAHVVLADINAEGAQQAAERLAGQHGAEAAMGVAADVTRPATLQPAVSRIVRHWGGVDLLVSNAGIVKAGSVMEQPLADFERVTRVNYTGYFAVVQAFAPVMARQHQGAPGRLFDIIQINSKSGLVGSNKNSAYAGGKFGGIGLTQSFALELVEHGIKVNAICPGNFLDGPLWSDPDRGLFAQYLQSGKVPGATSVADVRRFYESKVPMGRGCTAADVMHALFYLMEQPYETGQALPVTGGQVMLG
jgi:sorbitol-6-phosphate 2-dehydrogenase